MFSRRPTAIAATIITLLALKVKASGQILQIIDASNFCVMLPPNGETDRNISDTEWDANAFCMGSTPLAVGADTLPDGFITSAHYIATDAYVQVTGMIDYTKADLNGADEGGQYDIKAPTGSSCAGWDYYVNLIEPISNTYCIRCCNDTTNCNRGISQDGCAHIIPGDYSGPSSGSSTATSTTSTGTQSSTETTLASTTTNASSTTSTTLMSSTTSVSDVSITSTTTPIASLTSTSASSSSSSVSSNRPSDAITEQSLSTANTQHPTLLAIAVAVLLFTAALFI